MKKWAAVSMLRRRPRGDFVLDSLCAALHCNTDTERRGAIANSQS
jgi:hypothetical protein